MFFGSCKRNTQVQTLIDGVEMERVHENTFLGLTIEDKNTWKSHTWHIHNKGSRSISVLSELDHKPLHVLYSPLVLACLNYCAEVWSYTYQYCKKKAIQIIHNTDYRDHLNPLFPKSNKFMNFTDLSHRNKQPNSLTIFCLVSLGGTTAAHLPPSPPIPNILLCQMIPLYVLLHSIHKSSVFLLPGSLIFNFCLSTIPPLHM